MKNDLLIIETTVDSPELARDICAALLNDNLAACCQVSAPIISIYRWQGEVCEATEFKVTIKSLPSLYKKIESIIIDLHPYEVPEIIAYHSEYSLQDYAKWVKEVCNV